MRRNLLAFLLIVIVVLLAFMLGACNLPEYTVTFVLGDGRENVVATVSSGERLYTPDSLNEDEIFVGWYTDEARTTPYLSRRLTDDVTLYAKFVKKGDVVVTYRYDNGSEDETVVYSGRVVEPVAPIRTGCVFLGWKDIASGVYFDFDVEPTYTSYILEAVWRVAYDDATLTIDLQDGSPASSRRYQYNEPITKPATPSREGYIFVGWYSDKALTEIFDFSKPLLRDTTVYAGWTPDLTTLGNQLATKSLLSAVEVNTKHNNGIFSATTAISIGSGVIFKETVSKYYVLTNYHVIRDEGYSHREFIIIDAYGKEHAATLHKYNSSYDLALLSFDRGEGKLIASDLATENAEIGELLVSVGSPGSLNNSVTYGTCKWYRPASVNGVAVTFDVGWHDTPIASGSSGGAVFDANLDIVGINFAASENDDGSFSYGAFIPVEKVIEFLKTVDIDLGL